jgi:predicted nucleotidyltransferase
MEDHKNFVIPFEHIKSICQKSSIDVNKITNCYLYGSVLHGSAELTSDYDLLLVGDIIEDPLVFRVKKDPYFYEFERKTHEIEKRKYDVIFHSNQNFLQLLQINFLMFIEPLFADPIYQTINKVDYKQIYLQKFFSVEKIKDSLKKEFHYSTGTYTRFKLKKLSVDLGGKWVIKKMFNILRYYTSYSYFLLNKNFSNWGSLNDIKVFTLIFLFFFIFFMFFYFILSFFSFRLQFLIDFIVKEIVV